MSQRRRLLDDSTLNRARARSARHDWGGPTPVSAIDEGRPCKRDQEDGRSFYFNGEYVACCFCGVRREKHVQRVGKKAA